MKISELLKCTCKFSTFKHYNKIHQSSNGKICLNSIQLIIFQTYLLPILFCQSFSNFVITSLLCYLNFLKNYYFFTFVKKWTIFLLSFYTIFGFILPCFHPLMMIYYIQMHLNSFDTITSDGSKYIIKLKFLNINIKIYIAYVYKAHSYLISTILNKLTIVIQHFFSNIVQSS